MPLLKLQVPCFRILQVAALIGQGELRAYISKGQIAKIETRPTKQGRAPEGALELRDATRLKTGTRCKRTLRKIERNLYKKSTAVRYACENKTVVIEKNEDGSNYIVRIIE